MGVAVRKIDYEWSVKRFKKSVAGYKGALAKLVKTNTKLKKENEDLYELIGRVYAERDKVKSEVVKLKKKLRA